jgi:hypothetical protein
MQHNHVFRKNCLTGSIKVSHCLKYQLHVPSCKRDMFNFLLRETNEIYPKEKTGVSKHEGDEWYSNHTHAQKILHSPLITPSWVVIQSSKTLIWI